MSVTRGFIIIGILEIQLRVTFFYCKTLSHGNETYLNKKNMHVTVLYFSWGEWEGSIRSFVYFIYKIRITLQALRAFK